MKTEFIETTTPASAFASRLALAGKILEIQPKFLSMNRNSSDHRDKDEKNQCSSIQHCMRDQKL